MIRNLRGHRIRWSVLAAQGLIAGIVSAIAMLLITMLLIPLISAGSDVWSFARIVGSVFYGEAAVTPISGFDAEVVSAGLALHFAISAAAGVVFAILIGVFDIEGWTPVSVMGLIYGAFLFVWSIVLIEAEIVPASVEAMPLVAMLWGTLAFGICSGALLATWADLADMDQIGEKAKAFEGNETTTGLPL